MAEPFTPEQIAQILEEFFKVVGTRQYIGARYVPIFGRKDETSILWDNSAPYEPLTIVLYQGNSYTSRQYVPAGVDILNQEFWALTGNYNAQVEAYRTEVLQFSDEIEGAVDKANQAIEGVETLDTTVGNITDALPLSDFSAQSTVKGQMDNLRTELSTAIDDVADALPLTTFNRDNTVLSQINTIVESATHAYATLDNVTAAMPLSAFSAENTIANSLQDVEDTITTTVNPLRKTVEHDTIFNKKYIGKAVAPVVDGTWYGYYDDEYFQIQGMAVVNGNVYFGSHNSGDTRALITLANRNSNTFVWNREFSNSHIKHVNSMTWDSSRNQFMISGEVGGYGIRVADAAFNSVTASNLWPFATWVGRIAYDRVTNYGYVIDEANTNPDNLIRRLYKLAPNDSEFSYMCDIILPTYDLQDICAYDDKLFIITTTNAWGLYHIDKEAAACTLIESGVFTPNDANSIYYLGECEGCDFDSDGTLYASFSCGQMGVITIVPYEGKQAQPIQRNTFHVLNLHISNANRNLYRNAIGDMKSVSELSVRAYKSARSITYDDTIIEYGTANLKDVELIISSNANVTFNSTLTCAGGNVTLVNQGTLISNARELFTVYSAPVWLSINCTSDSTSTFNSAEKRVAYTNSGLGGLVYIHTVPSGFAGLINGLTATNKTLYGFGAKIGTLS